MANRESLLSLSRLTKSISANCIRLIFRGLICSVLHAAVELLQYIESFLALFSIGNETFLVVVVLNAQQKPARGVKILKPPKVTLPPRRESA
jgi:hypothetical protein